MNKKIFKIGSCSSVNIQFRNFISLLWFLVFVAYILEIFIIGAWKQCFFTLIISGSEHLWFDYDLDIG